MPSRGSQNERQQWSGGAIWLSRLSKVVASSFGIQVPCRISFSGPDYSLWEGSWGKKGRLSHRPPGTQGSPLGTQGCSLSVLSAFGTISKSLLRDLSVFLLLCIFTPITSWGLFIFMLNIYLLGDCHRALYLPWGHLIQVSTGDSLCWGLAGHVYFTTFVFNPDPTTFCWFIFRILC